MIERNINIDIAKTIAIICVVLIHVMSVEMRYTENNNFLFFVILNALPRIAVPLFLMSSGSLLLNKKKEITFKKLYSKMIPRILIALFLFAFLYKVLDIVIHNNISVNSVEKSILELLTFKHEFHLYYLHIILIVYIFLPITKVFINNASKKEVEYLLIIFFVLGIIYPTIKNIVPNFNLSGIPYQWLINMTYTSIGYTVLGFYLQEYKFDRKTGMFILFFGLLFTIIGTYFLSRVYDRYILFLYEGMSIGVCMYSFGVFVVINTIELQNKKIVKFFSNMSMASFTIYLVHVFFLRIINKYLISYNYLIRAILVLTLSYIAYLILQKNSMFKKWVI